ncbi:uracil-DNA glycosylase [Effusibacillus dendaii]|uniref:Uracil-DNA glycosylase n=1 Tax=Effusibacillus dendaii TaxID=2743772 RepID=A0A7I8DHF4_9BACL|nr:uracil-DNA glycosylase [Effusibacillus dendaii]BCJ87241.1 uracil-DNA glycosylase [Effusibacillus dendaii]
MTIDYTPTIWPEEPPLIDAVNCQKCELAMQRKRVIWGEGDPNAPIMVLPDNPGARETPSGESFVCGTRQTLQIAVHQVGLQKENLYITSILKCRPIRAYQKDTACSACLSHLNRQILEKSPQMSFCLGNVAVQSFWDDPTSDIKPLQGTWHTVRGIPTAVSYHRWLSAAGRIFLAFLWRIGNR